MKTLYRYSEECHFEDYSESTRLTVLEYTVIKETKCGFFIRKNQLKNRFVLKGSNGKRFAYEDKKTHYIVLF